MRLPTDLPSSQIDSTPHPIRHLKHILRHQNEHQGNTKLPTRAGGSSSKADLFLSNSSISPSVASGVAISGVGGAISGDRVSPPLLNICYTTNEVLVIIGVTCFLNFAFILLIMSCVHFFSTRASRLKSGVLVAENGEEYYYEDFPESDEECEWKQSMDKSFDRENRIDLLQYINNLP